MLGPFDGELSLVDVDTGAITSTTTATGIALDVLKAGDFKAMLHVTALDHTTGDETYGFSIIVADTVAHLAGSGTTVASITVTATGRYEIPLSGPHIAALCPTAAAITVKATAAGTTPSIQFGCYLTPAVC